MEQRARWDGLYKDLGPARERESWLEQYLPDLERRRDSPVADLGCGWGVHSLWLHARGFTVLACDFSDVALAALRAVQPEIPTLCFDMLDGFPEALRGVGTIVASLCTHYFSERDTARLYRAMYELLAPGGALLLRVNGIREFEEKDRPHAVETLEPDYYRMDDGAVKRYFTEESLKALLPPFERIRLRTDAFAYHGKVKHFVECLAEKGP